MFIFGGWFESSSSGRMIFLQDFYFLEPASVIWGVPRVRLPSYLARFCLQLQLRLPAALQVPVHTRLPSASKILSFSLAALRDIFLGRFDLCCVQEAPFL